MVTPVIPSIMLDVQYRMHPAISRFPSSEFYNFTLQDGTVDSVGNISPLLLPPTSQHLQADSKTGSRPSVIFLDHAGLESTKDRSRVNLNEAHLVAGVVEDLLLNNAVGSLLGNPIT
jgi:superfamily I DNA and/or RNA helicase